MSDSVIKKGKDGNYVLYDDAAYGAMAAVEAHNRGIRYQNCRASLELNAERVEHFKQRIAARGFSPADVVIVIINVDDPNGGPLAEQLMPGTDWQSFRDQGQVPFARGLVKRGYIQELVETLDERMARRLKEMKDEIAVVVFDSETACVFKA